jgi:hypothetical protein
MSEYKDPFWTEQTTKITTTTTTEPSNMKQTNNDDFDYTLFILAFVVGIIVIFISLTADNYHKMQQELEFVKAGLVQKVENGNVIWTKP